jgi:hypothetical protein
MGSQDTVLVSRKALVHRYADLGFRPEEVWHSADNYVDALGIAPRDTLLYSIHTAELRAFELYLNRMLVPVAPEEQEMRVAATTRLAAEIIMNWGITSTDVATTLGLDTSRGATYAAILDTLETALSSRLSARAVTASMDCVVVDGVTVDYPPAVMFAVSQAMTYAASQSSVNPF